MSRARPIGGGGLRPAALQMRYLEAAELPRLLAGDRLLAAFGFGAGAPRLDDPRWLRVPLQPLGGGTAPVEAWISQAPVRHGRDAGLAWASDGQLLFGALELEEGGDGIHATAQRAYARIRAFLAASPCPHLLRMWNYLDAITEGEGDAERYRQFCVGRAAGLGIGAGDGDCRLPAATAIGRCDGRRVLQVYWLAAREPGLAVENPRQLSAYRYPRQYGPQPPSFARAMLPAGAGLPLLISGTAAIVGHASLHPGRVQAQVDETLANLQALVDAARVHAPGLPPALGAGSLLKVYVRQASDAAAVAERLARQLPPALPRLLLHAQVCRRELLVEIDGLHGLPA